MLHRCRITGVGGFRPPVLTNDDFIAVMGRSARVVDRKLEHEQRFSALDLSTGRPRTTNTEMAQHASAAALQMAGIAPDDVDLVIYSTFTPDYPVPPCYTILQERLEISHCMGFDIRSGCAGFGTAMVAASQFLATGMARRALVVGSELISSRYLPYYANGKPDLPLKALFNLMFFGDGAGAVVLETCAPSEAGLFAVTMGSNRPTVPFGSLIPIGGSVHPYPTPEVSREEWAVTQDGPLTEEMVPAVAIEAIDRFLVENHFSLGDFDWAVLPIITESMRARLQARFPELSDDRVLSVGPQGGPLANAAIPLSLHLGVHEGHLRNGDRVLIYAAENTRYQHAVIGLTWNP